MNLKSGCIFWPRLFSGSKPAGLPLTRDVRCDIAIIGSGISGALAAYHFVREGIHAVLVDRRNPGEGSTPASTGLLQYEIDTPLIDLIPKIGRDRAMQAYRASVEALRAFEPLAAELGDDCGIVRRPSLYLATKDRDIPSLQAECEARRSIQIDVSFLKGDELRASHDLPRPAALRSSLAFESDPYRLTLTLLDRSLAKGLELYSHTEVVRAEPREGGITLHTASGPRIEARKAIFATGYEAAPFLPTGLCQLLSTYALVSEPVASFAPWRDRCLIWETARPYLYLRTTRDDRIIVGGEDEDIVDPKKRDARINEKAERLQHRFQQLFPAIPLDSTCAWAGTFAQTKDGLPYIGPRPEFPHAYFALGYGGNGITFSLLAARILLDTFLGRLNPHARLFGFERS